MFDSINESHFDDLKKGVPLQYITGEAFFYRYTFKVNKNVLIPRSETEILVEWAVDKIKQNKDWACILDIGVGPGTILLSILAEINNRDLQALGIDISNDVQEIFNANLNIVVNKNHQIHFRLGDRCSSLNEKEKFDLIVSNPPYIKTKNDLAGVHHQVLAYEPHVALFIDDDIYDAWFWELLTGIFKHLNSGGWAIVEGHENHLSSLQKMAIEVGFIHVNILNDYTQRNRFIIMTK